MAERATESGDTEELTGWLAAPFPVADNQRKKLADGVYETVKAELQQLMAIPAPPPRPDQAMDQPHHLQHCSPVIVIASRLSGRDISAEFAEIVAHEPQPL